ncbi:RrF2 family transcriptional regulator [Paenibacillus aestuarii]|uniref:RrF2 family transcriptional regulator n=1 Tax=Paenibacillus aestuarii TaxID=516965 RepID=A0ABW0KAL7_9BACL|nr:Rrf2 family transcriptional regulator [Paenibacillus aestuarii]
MSTTNLRVNIGPPRLKVAVHVLIRLAKSECLMTSSSIASLIKAHSVVVRRVMQALTSAGIVESKLGRDGGYFLRKPADEITLGEVYSAINNFFVEQEVELALGKMDENLFSELEKILCEVEKETINILRQYTITQVMNRTELILA